MARAAAAGAQRPMRLSEDSPFPRRHPRRVLRTHQLVPALGRCSEVATCVSRPSVVDAIVLMIEVPAATSCDPRATADAVDDARLVKRRPALPYGEVASSVTPRTALESFVRGKLWLAISRPCAATGG